MTRILKEEKEDGPRKGGGPLGLTPLKRSSSCGIEERERKGKGLELPKELLNLLSAREEQGEFITRGFGVIWRYWR